jgi:hypothetical protein
VLLALASGCVSVPETEAPPTEEAEVSLSEADRKFGENFLPLAREFGLSEFAYADRNEAGGVLYKFLPAGEELEGWSIRGTVLLLSVGSTWEEGQAALPRYSEFIAQRVTELYSKGILPGELGDVYFIHFRLGDGASAEHSLMANWQLNPGLLASFQVEQRPGAFSRRQVAHFQEIVRQLGRSGLAE